MAIGIELMIGLLLAQAAPAPAPAPDPSFDEVRAARRAEALRDGAPVIEQLLREAGTAHYLVRYDGTAILSLRTPGRATNTAGICESDYLSVEMARAADPPGGASGVAPRIRRAESRRQYHLLRDPWNAPRRDVRGEALATACADPALAGHSWSDAPSDHAFEIALQSLALVRRALGEPRSTLVRVRCMAMRGCAFDRAAMAVRLDPLFSGDVLEPSYDSTCGDAGRRCQMFHLSDMTICGHWQLEIESDYSEPLRLRSATFVERPGGSIHCGQDVN